MDVGLGPNVAAAVASKVAVMADKRRFAVPTLIDTYAWNLLSRMRATVNKEMALPSGFVPTSDVAVAGRDPCRLLQLLSFMVANAWAVRAPRMVPLTGAVEVRGREVLSLS